MGILGFFIFLVKGGKGGGRKFLDASFRGANFLESLGKIKGHIKSCA